MCSPGAQALRQESVRAQIRVWRAQGQLSGRCQSWRQPGSHSADAQVPGGAPTGIALAPWCCVSNAGLPGLRPWNGKCCDAQERHLDRAGVWCPLVVFPCNGQGKLQPGDTLSEGRSRTWAPSCMERVPRQMKTPAQSTAAGLCWQHGPRSTRGPRGLTQCSIPQLSWTPGLHSTGSVAGKRQHRRSGDLPESIEAQEASSGTFHRSRQERSIKAGQTGWSFKKRLRAPRTIPEALAQLGNEATKPHNDGRLGHLPSVSWFSEGTVACLGCQVCRERNEGLLGTHLHFTPVSSQRSLRLFQ